MADEQAEDLPLVAEETPEYVDGDNRLDLIEELTRKMGEAAENLEFEKAAHYRDEIARLKAEVA